MAGWHNPYDPRHLLYAWAGERRYEIVERPDVRFYISFFPFQYLRYPTGVRREVRVAFDDANLVIGECEDSASLAQAVGDSRFLLCILVSRKLRYRVSLRYRYIGSSFERELNALLGSSGYVPGAILGDPVLEGQFEVVTPSRDEGCYALPMPAREMLVNQFHGILEIRPGALAIKPFGVWELEPRSLDRLIHFVYHLYKALLPPGAPYRDPAVF